MYSPINFLSFFFSTSPSPLAVPIPKSSLSPLSPMCITAYFRRRSSPPMIATNYHRRLSSSTTSVPQKTLGIRKQPEKMLVNLHLSLLIPFKSPSNAFFKMKQGFQLVVPEVFRPQGFVRPGPRNVGQSRLPRASTWLRRDDGMFVGMDFFLNIM